MSSLPSTEPQVNPETLPFWEGTQRDELVLPRCSDCGFVIWYPRSFCPECRSNNVEWFTASGNGSIYSFTVALRGQGPWGDVAPFVIAYVELDEGPRMLTNVVDVDPDTVEIGLRVTVTFDPAGSYKLPRFRPAE